MGERRMNWWQLSLYHCAAAGKKAYGSRKDAKRAMKAVDPGSALNAYRCEHGDHWHFGHLPAKGRAA